LFDLGKSRLQGRKVPQQSVPWRRRVALPNAKGGSKDGGCSCMLGRKKRAPLLGGLIVFHSSSRMQRGGGSYTARPTGKETCISFAPKKGGVGEE